LRNEKLVNTVSDGQLEEKIMGWIKKYRDSDMH